MTLDEAICHCEEVAEREKAKGFEFNTRYNRENEYGTKCYECADEHRQLAEWLKELKQLREQTRWIPVSEGLPKEHEWIGTKTFGTTISDEVYVTFEMPNSKRFTDHLSFQNGKLSNFKQSEINAWHKGAKPIAWMPLPLPWEGE